MIPKDKQHSNEDISQVPYLFSAAVLRPRGEATGGKSIDSEISQEPWNRKGDVQIYFWNLYILVTMASSATFFFSQNGTRWTWQQHILKQSDTQTKITHDKNGLMFATGYSITNYVPTITSDFWCSQRYQGELHTSWTWINEHAKINELHSHSFHVPIFPVNYP